MIIRSYLDIYSQQISIKKKSYMKADIPADLTILSVRLHQR